MGSMDFNPHPTVTGYPSLFLLEWYQRNLDGSKDLHHSPGEMRPLPFSVRYQWWIEIEIESSKEASHPGKYQ